MEGEGNLAQDTVHACRDLSLCGIAKKGIVDIKFNAPLQGTRLQALWVNSHKGRENNCSAYGQECRKCDQIDHFERVWTSAVK